MTPCPTDSAMPAVSTGNSQRLGLLYVMSNAMMTTPSAANSNVPSIPLNASAESDAKPAGPVMCADKPGCDRAMTSILGTTLPARFQPSWPRSSGTIAWAALPSFEKTGPMILPSTLPRAASLPTSFTALNRSSGVSPVGRSYTTTAWNVLGDWNAFCAASTLVDSALPGSQDWASFFSTPVSLPASGPSTATTSSQKMSTSHLVLRPTITRVATLLTRCPHLHSIPAIHLL